MDNLVPKLKEQPMMWPDRQGRAYAAKTYESCPMCGCLVMHSNRTGVDVCEDACGYIVYPRRDT